MSEKVRKSDAEWRAQLAPEQYEAVLRALGEKLPAGGEQESEQRPHVRRAVGRRR